jgi:nucleoside-diphosphate-sugar epimerase
LRVLLTGATGFIGSHVARRLVENNTEVYALVRPGSNFWRIRDIADTLHLVKGDLLSAAELSNELERIRPDCCIHLAWYVEPEKYLDSHDNARFLTASINLASHLSKIGCRRFVAAGTCFEYDTNLGYLSESSPTVPRSLYAACKLGLQVALNRLQETTNMQVAWFRLFYQYGPFEDPRRLIPYVACALLRDQEARVTAGEQVRDYLHVEDVASAILAVCTSNLSGPVNIGSGTPVKLRDLVATIGRIAGRHELIKFGALPYPPSEPMFICANNYLLQSTGWKPRYDIEKGLSSTVAWWRQLLQNTSALGKDLCGAFETDQDSRSHERDSSM